MKILFGGSFDPIHNGHIMLALQVAGEFNHPVSLLPLAGNPNYKAPPQATLQQRLEMLEIIINKYPEQLNIDYNETRLAEYSPSCFTLQRLRDIYGAQEEFYFIIGGDSLLNLNTWDNWQDLFMLTNFIVAKRPEYPFDNMARELQDEVLPRIAEANQTNSPAGKIIFSDFAPMDISSTAIREAIYNNQNLDQATDPDVYKYIIQHNLYKGVTA